MFNTGMVRAILDGRKTVTRRAIKRTQCMLAQKCDPADVRRYLAGVSHRLMRDSIPFQVAIRFGLVRHMGDNVTFYFEKMGVEYDVQQ